MGSLISVAEVWVVSSDGTLLEPAGGLYAAAPALGAAARGMCFGRGEGLPGAVWEQGRPLLRAPLEGTGFRRQAAARAAGIRCALGWPVYAAGVLTSVVLMFCGETQEPVGAVELWHNDPRVTGDLTLAGGYFGATSSDLEALSRDTWLPRGAGAPGLAWQRDASVLIDRLADSTSFLRTQTAVSAGLVRALAMPCRVATDHVWVVNLLASASSPIARRVESWLPDGGDMHLRRAFGFCEVHGCMPADERPPWSADALGAIGRAAQSGVAQVGPAFHAALSADDAQSAALSGVLALPLAEANGVSEVLAFYL